MSQIQFLEDRIRHQRNRLISLVSILCSVIVIFAAAVLWSSSREIAFDHCVAWAITTDATGFCHESDEQDTFAFVTHWFFNTSP